MCGVLKLFIKNQFVINKKYKKIQNHKNNFLFPHNTCSSHEKRKATKYLNFNIKI